MNKLKKFFMLLFRPQKYKEVVFEEKKDRLVVEVQSTTGVRLTRREVSRIDEENFQRVHELLVNSFQAETAEESIERKARAVLHRLLEEDIINRPKPFADVDAWALGEPYKQTEDMQIRGWNISDAKLAKQWGRTPSAIQTRRQRLKNKD